jgi:hypothetical protein
MAPERGDVVLHPTESGKLVQQPTVDPRSGEVAEALGAQAIV